MARTPKPCAVPECDGLTNVPGTARGWCGLHYGRWQRTGDPLTTLRRRNVCTVDGCAAGVVGQSLCSKHYTRMKRYGTTEPPRPWLDLPDGVQWCSGCKRALPEGEFGRRGRCRPCGVIDTRRARARNPKPRPRARARCGWCAGGFLANGREKYCSTPCAKAAKIDYDATFSRSVEACREANRRWRVSHPHGNQAKAARYRARKFDAFDEDVDPLQVLGRDGWICALCEEPIDAALRWPHPLSASVDHREPLSRGGRHSMANCQAAHLTCNVRKGARLDEVAS